MDAGAIFFSSNIFLLEMEFLKRKLLLELLLELLFEVGCFSAFVPKFGINSFVTSATGASPEGFIRLYQYGNHPLLLLQHHLLLL
jgi:hypothetical protein